MPRALRLTVYNLSRAPYIALLATVNILVLAACGRQQSPPREEIKAVQTRIDVDKVPAFVGDDQNRQRAWEWTREVYRLRQFQPAWSLQGEVFPSTDNALDVLANAAAEGLDPEDFDLSELQRMRAALTQHADSSALTDFDLRLTNSLARYVSQLCFGRISPRDVDPQWPEAAGNCDVPRIVYDAMAQNTIAGLTEQLSPQLPEYRALKAGLEKYQRIAAQGGWNPLPAQAARKGGRKTYSDVLQDHLVRTGDLTIADGETATDDALTAALERFRARHGLQSRKNLDEATIRAINTPVEQRIDQIEINLDRMRWIAGRLEPRHIRVNIPAFHLSVHEDNQVPLEMRVIVGSEKDPTPILDGTIEYLVFSPYWNIPLRIASEEFLPKLKSDPNYLQRHQIEIVRVSGGKVQTLKPSDLQDKLPEGEYRLRQKPGDQNSLGLVKFMFPNPFDVYLHDTPSDNLFDRLTRTLSHGCVRLERPVDLATYLLRDQPEWTPEKIEAAMHADKETHVSLKTRVPLHLLYWTAWGDGEGNVQFRDDVYGYDERHRTLLESARTEPAP